MNTAGACGPLDVGDALGHISTDHIPMAEIAAAMTAVLASSAFDGPRSTPPAGTTVVRGPGTVAKVQPREHERSESVRWFDRVRSGAGIPAPLLLDAGSVDTGPGPRWWAVHTRSLGQAGADPTPERQRALGVLLRTWHEHARPEGLRLDRPGALGVHLGLLTPGHFREYARPPRAMVPGDMYLALSAAYGRACQGLPMTAIHSDVAVSSGNAIYDGDRVVALLDPGAIHIGPPEMDLSWALAVDLPRGAATAPLLDGYGRDAVNPGALDELLPPQMLRRLAGSLMAGNHNDVIWLHDELRRRSPALLASSGLATRAALPGPNPVG